MNIGIDFRMGGRETAGIGRYILELLKAILAVDTENKYIVFYNSSVASKEDIEVLSQYANVSMVETGIRHYSLAEQLRFPKILNQHNLDLVHFPNFNVPVRYKGSYVVTIHDMVHHRLGGHKKTHLLHFKAYQYVIQKAVERAKAIITPSESARNEVVHYYPSAEHKTKVIYEGVTLTPQSEDKIQEVKRTFLLTRPYFLFVGTLERKKNIVSLARGFDEFITKYQLNMDLVFAGKVDPHAQEEKFRALEVQHKDRLVFTGFVSDEDLAALYQGAYAYTTASMNEGFGLPGVEAMQFGLPLLVSNSDVFNEVYDAAAIYFDATNPQDIAEKMRLVATDTQFYEQLRSKSLARHEFFSWEKAARETLEVYKQAGARTFTPPQKSLDADSEVIPEE